jgi:hypothetical protein
VTNGRMIKELERNSPRLNLGAVLAFGWRAEENHFKFQALLRPRFEQRITSIRIQTVTDVLCRLLSLLGNCVPWIFHSLHRNILHIVGWSRNVTYF